MKWLALGLVLLAQQEKELRVAWGTPRSLDPAHAGRDARLALSLFTGLTTFAQDGITVVPGAAEKWTAGDDGLVWTFHLRDAKWSDGAAVTAQDFRFAWLRSLSPETGSSLVFAFAPVRGALAFWEDRRIDQDLLAFEAQPAAARLSIAERFRNRATKRHVEAVKRLPEKEPAVRAVLEAAGTAAASRADIDEKSVGVEAVDARTLRVTLGARAPTLLEDLAGPAFLPVPAGVVEARRDQWTHPQHIATNGPYRVEKWTRDELALVRASGSGPERVVLVLGEHAGSAFDAYERGKVDWIDRALVPPEKVAELAKRGEVRTYATFSSSYLVLNASREPCSRAGVRRALARGVDRSRLLKHAGPGAEVAIGLVPPGVPGYAGASAPPQDSAAAVRLLLGEYPDLTKFPKLSLLGPKSAQGALFTLKEQLEKDLGIRVRTDVREWRAHVEALEGGDYDIAYAVWTGVALDPASFLDPFAVRGGAEFDGLLAEAAKERDTSRRLGLLARAEAALLAEGGPVVPLHTGGDFVVARPWVKLAFNPMGRALLQHVRYRE